MKSLLLVVLLAVGAAKDEADCLRKELGKLNIGESVSSFAGLFNSSDSCGVLNGVVADCSLSDSGGREIGILDDVVSVIIYKNDALSLLCGAQASDSPVALRKKLLSCGREIECEEIGNAGLVCRETRAGAVGEVEINAEWISGSLTSMRERIPSI